MRLSVLLVLVLVLTMSAFSQPPLTNPVKGNLVVEGNVLPRYARVPSLGSILFPFRAVRAESGFFNYVLYTGGVAITRAESLHVPGAGKYESGDSLVSVSRNATLHGTYTFINDFRGSPDSLFHRLWIYSTPTDTFFLPLRHNLYTWGGPSNRWLRGYYKKLGRIDVPVESLFVTTMVGTATNAETLGGRAAGVFPDTTDPALHWGKVGGDLKRTRISLKDSTGVDITIAGDTAKVSLEPTVSLDTMKAKRGAFDTLAVAWTIPKHTFGNGGINLTDTTLVVGLITSDCIAVGVNYRYDSGASTYNSLQIRFAVVDTFYIYRIAATDPDSLENFTIFKKK